MSLPTDSGLAGLDLYRIQVRELEEYAMFVMNAEGLVVSWNAGVERILGYSEQECIGQHTSVIFTPADKAREVCDSEMQIARENGYVSDIRWHRRKDGAEFYADGFMNAIRDDSGLHIGDTKVISDDTPRKRLQDSLTESNAALEQFAYVASHDLQEPLRTLSSYAQLLGRKYKDRLDEDGAQMLGFILEAAGRMSTLVRDLLEYACAPLQTDRPGSIALDDDVEAALTHLAKAIEESGGSVTHAALPMVRAVGARWSACFRISSAMR